MLLSPVGRVAGISGQYPLVQNMTVTEGGTANLTCRVEYNDNTSLQWSNPAQQTLFFGDKKGELDNDSSGSPVLRVRFVSRVCFLKKIHAFKPFQLEFRVCGYYCDCFLLHAATSCIHKHSLTHTQAPLPRTTLQGQNRYG